MQWFNFLLRHLEQLRAIRAELGQKGWYQSKTLWFNVLTLASAAGVIVWGSGAELSDADAMAIAIVISSMVNTVLRVVTLRPVWARGPVDSKTLWVNGVAAVAAVLVLVYGNEARIPTAELVGIGLGLHALANFGLRLVTRQPVGLQSVPPADPPADGGGEHRGPQSSPDLV